MAGMKVNAMPIIFGMILLGAILIVIKSINPCGTNRSGKSKARKPEPRRIFAGISDPNPLTIVTINKIRFSQVSMNFLFFNRLSRF